MEIAKTLCMNGGDSEASYAHNSLLQKKALILTKHIKERSVKDCYETFLPEVLVMADLGCASGPNAFLPVSEVINSIGKICSESGHTAPTFLLYLNELPSNDFNATFQSLQKFYQGFDKESKQCFVAAMPGSFYGRLFPRNSLHFVHSSYSLHWLSQVPTGLIGVDEEPLNKGNICVAETSSLAVQTAYCEQFRSDFDMFLRMRSEEMMPGGGMVLTLLGSSRKGAPFECMAAMGLVLLEMAKEGLIEEPKLDGFNLPAHVPCKDEIREVVQNQGSFEICELEILKIGWDVDMDDQVTEVVDDKHSKGDFVATYMRAVTEPLLVAAFGEAPMDDFFHRLARKYADLMEAENCVHHNLIISMKKTLKG